MLFLLTHKFVWFSQNCFFFIRFNDRFLDSVLNHLNNLWLWFKINFFVLLFHLRWLCSANSNLLCNFVLLFLLLLSLESLKLKLQLLLLQYNLLPLQLQLLALNLLPLGQNLQLSLTSILANQEIIIRSHWSNFQLIRLG